jgi:catechol 2,3-dioxygenase-like lactoylglutathione lyase family enzyme
MIKGLHHAGLSVQDLDRSIEFYRTLGVELVCQGSWDRGPMDSITALTGTRGRSAMLKIGGQHLELFEFASPAGKPADPARPVCDHGITHFCIEVCDVQSEYLRLVAAGVRFNCEPQDFGAAKATYARDPDGNVVELAQFD